MSERSKIMGIVAGIVVSAAAILVAGATGAADPVAELSPPENVGEFQGPGTGYVNSGSSRAEAWTETYTDRSGRTQEVPYVWISNEQFRLASIGGGEHVLVKEVATSRHCLFLDPPSRRFRFEAWPLDASSGSQPIWVVETWGYAAEILDQDRFGRMLKVRGGGCCGDRSPDFYYDLATGEKLFDCNGLYLRVDDVETGARRFVTFQPRGRARVPDRPGMRHIGTLEYGPRPAAIRFQVLASDTIAYSLRDLQWIVDGEPVASNHLTRYSGQILSGFAVSIELGRTQLWGRVHRELEPLSVEVPIVGDSPAVDDAWADGAIRLEFVREDR